MKGKFRRRLPPETLARLPAYRHQLQDMERAGEHVVSSKELASRLNVSDAQLRRDLSYLALLGRPGLGYEVGSLLQVTSDVLGLDRQWSV
ncbi:MAG TPA: winged-helix domain-containing protein, partial [Stenomitos sp.]